MSSIRVVDGEELLKHFEHEIKIAKYLDGEEVVNIAIECIDCYEVLGDDEEDYA